MKKLKENFSKLNLVISERENHHDQVEYISGMQNWFNAHKAFMISVTYKRKTA